MNRTDRDDRLEEAGHAPAPTRPVAKARADGQVERDQRVDVRVAVAVGPEARHRGLQQASGCP